MNAILITLITTYATGIPFAGILLSGLLCAQCYRCRYGCQDQSRWKYNTLPQQTRCDQALFCKIWTAAFLLVLTLWTLAVVLWFSWSPISVCSSQWMHSSPPDRQATDMESWEGFWCTRPCKDSTLVHASTVAEVSAAIRAASTVRVVGSGHSVTDLQCPDPGGVVLSIDGLCAFGSVEKRVDGRVVATFSAGCSIYNVQRWLVDQGYQLIGYGAIMSQTVAGALATSLHGEYTACSFGDNLISLVAVLASGEVVVVPEETDEVFAWVGSMGELGVVVEVAMRVWPTMRVICETRRTGRGEAEAALVDHTLDILEIDTLVGASPKEEPYVVRTCREVASPITGSPIATTTQSSGAMGLLYETFGLTALRLMSTLTWVRSSVAASLLLDSSKPPQEEYAVDRAFSSAEGLFNVHAHSEIAVPMEHCFYALDRLRTEARRLSLAYAMVVKVLAPSRAWRTWAAKRSCSINIDFYDFGHADSVDRDLYFRGFAENLAVDQLSGGLHLGKMWVRPDRWQLLKNAPRVADFEQLRQRLDPNDKFQNEHTRAIHGDGRCKTEPIPTELDARSALWRTSIWCAFVLSVFVCIGSCVFCATTPANPPVDAARLSTVAVHTIDGARRSSTLRDKLCAPADLLPLLPLLPSKF